MLCHQVIVTEAQICCSGRRGQDISKNANSNDVHCERERSPHRWDCDGGFGNMVDNQAQQSPLPSQREVLLQEGNALQCLIVMQAKVLQDVVQKLLNLLLLPITKAAAMSVQELLRDYINKACALATKVGVLEVPGGNCNGSLPIRGQVRKSRLAPTPIPMCKVFAHLNPSIQDPPQVHYPVRCLVVLLNLSFYLFNIIGSSPAQFV